MRSILPAKLANPTLEKSATYFPGLNALRFIAASLVVLFHVDDLVQGLAPGSFRLHLPHEIGGLAVTFFFVLSGFLITYLLLQEKHAYGTVAIKKFYWRRILRIWPLYYLVLLLAFVLLNNPAFFPSIADLSVYQQAPTNLLLYLALLPQVAWVLNKQIIYANQLWSVGVEEQFYLVWPLLIKYLSRRQQFWFMVLLVGAFVVVRNGAAFLLSHYPAHAAPLQFFINLLTTTRIDCMAIGGLGAYAYYFHPAATQRFISSTVVDLVVLAAVLVLVFSDRYIPYVMYEVYSVLFCYIILSSSCKPGRALLRLEGPVWSWMGKLSYGIYMWHMVVQGLVLLIIKKGAATGMPSLNALLYCTVLPLTIVCSWLSYKYIEKPFLNIKKQFVLIKSRAS